MYPYQRDKLVSSIQTTLEQEFIITPGHRHFLESTFSVTTPEELESMLNTGNDDDRDLLLELIVSPDDSIQLRLEPVIQSYPFSEGDIPLLIEKVKSRIHSICIGYFSSGPFFHIDVPPYIIERFIEKLAIHHRIPGQLYDEMNRFLSKDLKSLTCVSLRQGSFIYNPEKIEFLTLFIEKFGYMEKDYPRLIEFVLPLLSGSAQGSDLKSIQNIFINTLSLSRKHLSQIRSAQDMLKSNTMESLILQGVFIPPISEDEVAEKQSMLTEILFRVFGWTESMGTSPTDIDLGNHTGNKSVKEIIKLLS